MTIFKKPFSDQTISERNSSKLEESRLTLDAARISLEDHLFHASEAKLRIRMLEQRIARLESERGLLPEPAEQVSWLRKVVLYVRDAFTKPAPTSVAFSEALAEGVTEHYCRHINENVWVHCTRQDYLELRVDPLYDTVAIPAGKQPPDVSTFQTSRYKPKDASAGGGWAACSHTFWKLNYKSPELEFAQ